MWICLASMLLLLQAGVTFDMNASLGGCSTVETFYLVRREMSSRRRVVGFCTLIGLGVGRWSGF